MGVKIRKRGGKWYVFVNYHGRRKAKCVGSSRELAEQVRRQLEAKLALGDLGFLSDSPEEPTFATYAEKWLKTDALRCKPSTVDFYRDYQERYVIPRFGQKRITTITRDEIKAFMSDLTEKGLAKNTIRLATATLRVVLSAAVEDGILASNPGLRLGRFLESRKAAHEAQAMTREEAQIFLEAAKEFYPEFHPLFLMALRAGLRKGELLAVRWGDIQFGTSDNDPNRYILVQRNYVHGRFTTPKSKKSRRADMSRELRGVLLELRDKRMLEAFMKGKTSIAEDLVFPSKAGTVLDQSNLTNYQFLPCLDRAGLRRFRFHDLRHSFGSLLIRDGASLAYVKDQMGHSSIQVTVDTYGHLIPGADIAWVDRLDVKTKQQQNATPAQLQVMSETEILPEVVDLIGGPTRIRTWNQQIMSLLL
jgi:integrase